MMNQQTVIHEQSGLNSFYSKNLFSSWSWSWNLSCCISFDDDPFPRNLHIYSNSRLHGSTILLLPLN